MGLAIERITDRLPDGLDALRAEAMREGHRLLDRLAAEWADGTSRFDRAGESLLAACLGNALIGIGGLTIDPSDSSLLRMRRFYVAPRARRSGVASALVHRLIAEVGPVGHAVSVNAGTSAAPAFWEALGFRPVQGRPYTHRLSHPA